MQPLFPNGYRGLSDSRWSGVEGSVAESVGIDAHSTPGLIKVHQKLTKQSGDTVTELCEAAVPASDGSKVWFSKESGKIWRENAGTYTLMYELVLGAYNILTALQTATKDLTAQADSHLISMKPDGTVMFSIDGNAGSLNHYTLSTAKDISTATFVDTTNIPEVGNAEALFVRSDGLKMYVLANDKTVYQYTLGTAWDGSTLSYDSKSFNFLNLGVLSSMWFSSDGTAVYLLDFNGTIHRFTLDTAWDISTVTTTVEVLSVGGGGGGGGGDSGAAAGGGGAGQFLEWNGTFTVGSYAVVVGAGGAGGPYNASGGGAGTKGGTSSVGGGLDAEGGGFGAFVNGGNSTNGSGGGSCAGTAGTGVFNGGRQTSSGDGGGGGGGSSAAGANTTTDSGGAGGAGTASSITGSSVTYATGGNGGDRSGGAGSAGAANTGNGGRGGGSGSAGGAGGSGIVVISYPTGSITATGGTVTTSGGNTIHTFTTNGTFEVTAIAGYASFTKAEGEPDDNRAIAFSADGTKLLISSGNTIFQYTLGTAWDITTATYDNVSFPFPVVGTTSFGGYSMAFDGNGSNLYISRLATGIIYQYQIDDGTTGISAVSAIEFKDLDIDSPNEVSAHIIWSTERYVFSIAVADLADWTGKVQVVGRFTNGDDTYHPMVIQNAALFIGDARTIAQMDSNGVFYASTSFNVPDNERIQSIEPLDIDVVVGTSYGQYARILRWDTVSESWSSEDFVFEDGIKAFIRDDNFLYAYAGNQGRIYFYNGEKLERFTRIRGDWNASNTAIVRSSSVGYYNGIPVFGLSTGSGTPCKMGVYTLGSFSPSYPIALDLAYPKGNTYDTLQFGAILIDGNDMYVSAEDGIYQVDHSAKYEHAHFETRQLSGERGATHKKYTAEYTSLPANTGIGMSYRNKYANAFTALAVVNDVDEEEVRADLSVPSVTSLQMRYDFTVDGNNAPEVEQFRLK